MKPVVCWSLCMSMLGTWTWAACGGAKDGGSTAGADSADPISGAGSSAMMAGREGGSGGGGTGTSPGGASGSDGPEATAGSGSGSAGARGSSDAGPADGNGFDGGTEPDRNAVTAGTICERFATLRCAGEAACCDNPGRDFATCKQAELADCTDGMAEQIANAAPTAFDAAQAETVFTEIERLASECDPSLVAFIESHQGLRSMFNGTVAPDAECTPLNPLDDTMAAIALASCADAQAQACLPSLVRWTCQPHADAGGPCFTDVNCNPGLFCDNDALALSGAVCTARKPLGETCVNSHECQSLLCRTRPGGGTAEACVAASRQTAYCLVH